MKNIKQIKFNLFKIDPHLHEFINHSLPEDIKNSRLNGVVYYKNKSFIFMTACNMDKIIPRLCISLVSSYGETINFPYFIFYAEKYNFNYNKLSNLKYIDACISFYLKSIPLHFQFLWRRFKNKH